MRSKEGKRGKLSARAEDFIPKNRPNKPVYYEDPFDYILNTYYAKGNSILPNPL